MDSSCHGNQYNYFPGFQRGWRWCRRPCQISGVGLEHSACQVQGTRVTSQWGSPQQTCSRGKQKIHHWIIYIQGAETNNFQSISILRMNIWRVFVEVCGNVFCDRIMLILHRIHPTMKEFVQASEHARSRATWSIFKCLQRLASNGF